MRNKTIAEVLDELREIFEEETGATGGTVHCRLKKLEHLASLTADQALAQRDAAQPAPHQKALVEVRSTERGALWLNTLVPVDELRKVVGAKLYAAPIAEAREPLGWIYEDTLPDSYPYSEMFKHSAIRDGVRMFPVYAP